MRQNSVLKIIDRILIDCTLYAKGQFDCENVIKEKISLGFNAEHFTIKPGGTLWRRKGALSSEEEVEELIDFLSEYLSIAKKYNFKVFVYLNVHWHDLEDLKTHPDWFQVDYNGKVITDVYGRGLMPCVNSPSWREFSIRVMEKIAEVGPYGIFLDGPVFHPRGCYCKYCLEKFISRYRIRPPRKGDLLNKDHLKLIEFQQDSLTDYMREAYERVKRVNENVLLYLNGEPLRPNWSTGRDNVKLAKYQDLVGAEGGFEYYNLLESPFFKCSMTAKLLEAQVPDKPRVIFIAAKHSPWNNEPLTPAELKLRCAETLANGAYYWIGYTCKSPELEEAMKEINSWIDGNEEYFENTRNIAKVGLYWSQLTANVYGGEVPISDFTGRTIKFVRDYVKSFLGAYEILVRAQIPFKLVIKPEQLKDINLLILPNVACLTENEIEAIREFVKNGGRLIASFETSLYSTEGDRLSDFCLSEVFGVKYLGIEEYGSYENYMKLVNDKLIPAYTYVIKCEVTSGKPLSHLSEKIKGWYQPLRFTKFPGVVENDYGKGKSIYFAGNFFQTYKDFKFASYLKLFKELVTRLIDQEIIVEKAPLSLEVNVRGKGNIIEIHLVNFTSELMRPIHNIIPLHDVGIRIRGLSKINEVFNLINKEAKLSWYTSEKELVIGLSELREYEVIVIK